MEVVEDLKVEKTWANVVELKHPLADYLIAYIPPRNMAIIIEFVHGVPYGYKVILSTSSIQRPRAAWLLQSMSESAALSGNWSAVERIVEIGERSRGWPITEDLVLWALSNHLEENPRYWLSPQSEHWLRFAEVLSKYPYIIYVAVAAVALATAGLYKRRKQIRY